MLRKAICNFIEKRQKINKSESDKGAGEAVLGDIMLSQDDT